MSCARTAEPIQTLFEQDLPLDIQTPV